MRTKTQKKKKGDNTAVAYCFPPPLFFNYFGYGIFDESNFKEILHSFVGQF